MHVRVCIRARMYECIYGSVYEFMHIIFKEQLEHPSECHCIINRPWEPSEALF